ncbi:MAG: 4-aminobutyrate--2-oxoglutarate transaminase [bacterium]|jgi:4-aminobutyrate aminotransferase/(S)-3-amino-2-methylpropionate transaminase|nr:4-aminobutyrate--2-oxoglutarate transaminase [candidate division KSB1 bacterium]MDH7559892.1 4-aminobutyrate--2-oxoglutarate transaminase [bacterium]
MQEENARRQIPGPESIRLMQRKQGELPPAAYTLTPIFIAEAHGAQLVDVDGNRFIDFAGGIGVLNVGHTHPKVVEAVIAQVRKFTHSCFHVLPYESYVALAARLNRLAPGDSKKKTILVNSGAEAVENAVKIAKYHTGRYALVSFEHGYHGRTYLTMSLNGKVAPYRKGFGPGAPEVYHLRAPYCYRCPHDKQPNSCATFCASRLEEFFMVNVDPQAVAAVIFEPVLGEGGFVPFPQAYLAALREFCRAHGILLIADEIQTGWGRTGRLFACEHYGLEPDILVTAKSLAGGLPLAAVIARAEVVDGIHPAGLGGTFSGNPVSCAAALAVLEVSEEEGLVKRAEEIGTRVRGRFRKMQERYPLIGDVRGLGAMNALELVKDRATKEPAPQAVTQVLRHCYEHGLVVLKAGTYNNCIRTLMPLVISDEELAGGLDILEQAIASAAL